LPALWRYKGKGVTLGLGYGVVGVEKVVGWGILPG